MKNFIGFLFYFSHFENLCYLFSFLCKMVTIAVLFVVCSLCVDYGSKFKYIKFTPTPSYASICYSDIVDDWKDYSNIQSCLEFQKELSRYFKSFEIEELTLFEIPANDSPGNKQFRSKIHISDAEYFEFLGKYGGDVMEEYENRYQFITPSGTTIFKWETTQQPTAYEEVRYHPITQAILSGSVNYFMDAKAFLESPETIKMGYNYLDIAKGYLERYCWY